MLERNGQIKPAELLGKKRFSYRAIMLLLPSPFINLQMWCELLACTFFVCIVGQNDSYGNVRS
jgi:hypothetical protein